MDYRFQYATEEDKEKIIEDNKDKFLYEILNIAEGNFLIFTDAKPEIQVVEVENGVHNTELSVLSKQVSTFMNALGLNKNIE